MARVVLAMSGGVDSSVAAHLLQQQGHEVIGVFMRHGESEPAGCSWSDEPAVRACQLSSPARTTNRAAAVQATLRMLGEWPIAWTFPSMRSIFQSEFRQIIDYFVEQYLRGRTPNPCVVCNHWLKFGKLFEYADSVDAQFVATGHYARCRQADDGTAWLQRGVDL